MKAGMMLRSTAAARAHSTRGLTLPSRSLASRSRSGLAGVVGSSFDGLRGGASTSSSFARPAPLPALSPQWRLSSLRCQSTAAVRDDVVERPSVATAVEKKASSKAPFVPTPERKYENFLNVTVTPSGVALVKFDCPKSVNTISFDLFADVKKLWDTEITGNPNVKAVVFGSAKPGTFIAGADITDISQMEDKSNVIPIIAQGLEWFQSIQKSMPLVAAIDGPALGGGLEWAMWCHYRICTDSAKTKLGLPEVKLGLLPGFGGTQNLPDLVGLQTAMDMMLTGKELRPAQAKKAGLVDLVVAPQSLEQVAIQSAEQLVAGTLKPKRKAKSMVNRLLEDTSLGRSVIWNQVEKLVQKNTGGNYPSPNAIIKVVKNGIDNPKTKFVVEREEFAKLAATPESEALIGIFQGMTALKKHNFGQDTAAPVSTIAVLGAGLMGSGIAQVSAEKGLQVLLKDRNDEAVGRGQSYMNDNWQKKVNRKRMTQYQSNINQSNVVPLVDASPSLKQHLSRADMIIEAVFEDINLKRKIVAEMEQLTPDRTIFCTNTSAIPIRDIAVGAKRPSQIIGMHYFSPVPSMPLLEIIPHDGTDDRTTATAFEVGTKQGKTCIVVKDVPGFYVNRCLGPYLVEVSALVKDGVGLEELDKAITKFGMPVGPITLADEVGIDVASHVATFLSNADLGVRMSGGDVGLMKNMMDKGWLGKKSGQGFYTYKGKKGSNKSINPEVQAYVKAFATRSLKLDEKEIQDRIIGRFVNEAAMCLQDEIIENPVVGDIGLVFGTGFAPFRGGPFRYLDQIGVSTFVDRMNSFVDKYGPQFEPCDLLTDHAKSMKKFHPR